MNAEKISDMLDLDFFKAQRVYVVDATDAQMYDEVMTCCEHGLYREAYIMTWILIVESLRRKIRRLYDLEDKRAKAAWPEIEKIENEKKSNDCIIYKNAVECEAIDPRYEPELDYFWLQRCKFAHPYESAPDELSLTQIITKALEMVLIFDVTYHKDRMFEILENEATNFFIVPRDATGQEDHIKRHLLLIRPAHYPPLYKELFAQFSKAVEAKNEQVGRYFARFIKIFLETTTFDLNADNSGIARQIRDYPMNMWILIKLVPIIWDRMEANYQDSLFNYISITGDKPLWSIQCACKLFEDGKPISQPNEDIYYNRLAGFPITDTWVFYANHDKLLDRVKIEWVSTNQFTKQASYVDWLKMIQSNLSFFTEEELKSLGGFFGECCQNNTFMALQYLDNLDDSFKTSPAFVNGIVRGACVKYDALYLPGNCIVSILSLVSWLSHEEQSVIVSELGLTKRTAPSNNLELQSRMQTKIDDLKQYMSDVVYNEWCAIVNSYFADQQTPDEFALEEIM